jgi:hypothetical protein
MQKRERRALGLCFLLSLGTLLGLGFVDEAAALLSSGLHATTGPDQESQAIGFGMLAFGMAGLAAHPSLGRGKKPATNSQASRPQVDADRPAEASSALGPR